MMEGRLRTIEQGADTAVWLALCRAASRSRSGQFFQGVLRQNKLIMIFCAGKLTYYQCLADRKPIPVHLPLAWTRSSSEDIQSFMAQLEALANAIQSKQPDIPPSYPDLTNPAFV